MHIRKLFASAAVAAAAVAPALVVISAAPAGATTVTTEAELRAAVESNSETSVVLANDITITDCSPTGGDLSRDGGAPLTIDGAGFTIEQTCEFERVINVNNGDLTLVDVTLTGGDEIFDEGGGVFVSDGTLVVTGSTITGNAAGNGGGISVHGALTVTDSVVSDNQADPTGGGEGGGIWVVGPMTLDGVEVTGNAAFDAGGVSADSGDRTISNSVIAGNTADATGGESGGMGFGSGQTTIVDTTISGNSADFGGGFVRYGGGPASETVVLIRTTVSGNTAGQGGAGGFDALKDITLVNSTVTGNVTTSTDGSGGAASTETMTLVYSTIVGNTGTYGANVATATALVSFGSVVADPLGGGENCAGPDTVTSYGYNFSDDTSCGFTDATDVQGPGNDPLLGALANNGGPTQTMLPQTSSPLLDKIPAAACQSSIAAGVSTDQRGVTRPQGSGCDIGAVEVAVATPIDVNPRFTG